MDLGDGYEFYGYGQFNVLLGRNGCGKSTFLRHMDYRLSDRDLDTRMEGIGCVRYITPERAGQLQYQASLDARLQGEAGYNVKARRRNSWVQFRESVVVDFRNFEVSLLRLIERDPEVRSSPLNFDSTVSAVNEVLDRVRIVRDDVKGFRFERKKDGGEVSPDDLSSGENEIVCLAIEIMYFAYLANLPPFRAEKSWMLLDEPDVHLHPDLQYRLMKMLVGQLRSLNVVVVVATHSTSILAALRHLSCDVRMGFKEEGSTVVNMRPVNQATEKILPMFGAHPLANVFTESPPLIVEGDDDERIWQTAVRRSGGRLSLFPCVAGNIQSLAPYEQEASNIINAVYEGGRAYSIRDRDDATGEIDDLGPVVRMRLNCRAAENLLLTDDALREMGVNWCSLLERLREFQARQPSHQSSAFIKAFEESGWDRRSHDIKRLRMTIVSVSECTKPWEVVVGRSIARMVEKRFRGEYSLEDFLGDKVVRTMKLIDEV